MAVATLLAPVALAGCGSANGAPSGGGTVTVFAAASLTEAFTKIGKDFEAANPGTAVRFNFAGSAALATQINQGAPADVFASAAPANLKTVIDAGNGIENVPLRSKMPLLSMRFTTPDGP